MAAVIELTTYEIQWPLVIVRAPVHGSVESVTEFCERSDEFFAREERFATVQDMREMKGIIDANARKVMSEWTANRQFQMAKWHVASASVVASPVLRGIITAIHWFAKPPSPQIVTGSMKEAVDFVLDQLEAEGVEVDEAARDLARRTAAT